MLGYLASDEIDDDLVYQMLVTLSTTLSHFAESDQFFVISMLRSLSRIIPGLLPGSRYAASIFWLAVAILQLSYIPLFAAGLELMLVALRALETSAPPGQTLVEMLAEARRSVGDPARKLDQVCGVSFETDWCFALVAVVLKGVRHPSTRTSAIEVLMELLKVSTARSGFYDENPSIPPSSTAFFVAVLPVMCGSPADFKALFEAAGLEISDEAMRDPGTCATYELLTIS